jgi:hypothetical protein
VYEIAEREAFYKNMVWIFDATKRFEMIRVGRRTFFALGKTEHIRHCKKKVFLDFGNVLIEVEEFSKAVARFDGFGWTRSREWFAKRYLSGRLRDGTSPKSFPSSRQCRCCKKRRRYKKTQDASRWNDPETNTIVTIPKDSIFIPCTYQFIPSGKQPIDEWERIVDQLPQIANGWTKDELDKMKQLLNGTIMILDRVLRLMPSSPEREVKMTAREMQAKLDHVEEHIAAGRIPILEETMKRQLIESAKVPEKWMNKTFW